jgi:hypothetical protein
MKRIHTIIEGEFKGAKEELYDYVLKENEIEYIFTQQEIDEIAATELATKTKEDAIKGLKETYTVIWTGETFDGLKSFALVLKNDGKTETIEI